VATGVSSTVIQVLKLTAQFVGGVKWKQKQLHTSFVSVNMEYFYGRSAKVTLCGHPPHTQLNVTWNKMSIVLTEWIKGYVTMLYQL
jgi:hypothetical protein